MDGLRVPLSELRRGAVELNLRLEDPGSELGELPLPFPFLDVELAVERYLDGGVRAHGSLRASIEIECRRCLVLTSVSVESKINALFRPRSDVTPGEEGVWSLDPGAGDVDLAGPIREELWVSAPEYALCRPDCLGMCPRCGVRLADEACRCPPREPDPRWASLRGGGG